MKLKELKQMGYTEADVSWARGYVSRKQVASEAECHIAGGSRKGEYYYLAPSDKSTRYCLRVYLCK